ncbi:MAG: antitoxin [Austwickia sp.]|nr:antitoxin [Actinomycetota bacterium]MCO5308653.1 antitoxin [Austwickia sp.]
MGIFDSAKDKLNEATRNEGHTDSALDKASEMAKGRVEGHDDKIDKAREMADGRLGDEGHQA